MRKLLCLAALLAGFLLPLAPSGTAAAVVTTPHHRYHYRYPYRHRHYHRYNHHGHWYYRWR